MTAGCGQGTIYPLLTARAEPKSPFATSYLVVAWHSSNLDSPWSAEASRRASGACYYTTVAALAHFVEGKAMRWVATETLPIEGACTPYHGVISRNMASETSVRVRPV